MKYFKMFSSTTVNGIVPPGLNGEFVKGKEEFFKNKKCGPNTFYDKNYEFDYLVPMEFGDGRENEPSKIICDYHLWFGESPRGGWLRPLSEKFKNILEQFNLCEHRFYPASVLFQNEKHPYYVMQIFYDEYKSFIDFKHTIFNNRDLFGNLEDRKLETHQFNSLEKVENYAEEKWGCELNWNYEKVVMHPEFKAIDFIRFHPFGDIVSERLKDAIEASDLIGISFKELPIPIEFSDEV